MKSSRKIVVTLMAAVTLGFAVSPSIVNASDSTQTVSPNLESELSKYVKIANHKFVVSVPEGTNVSSEKLAELQQVVDTVNKELADYNVEVDQSVPTISLARAKSRKSTSLPKPVAYGANGYWYRDKKGGWHYVVTKSPAQAVFDVFRNGVESSLGGGWISGAEKTKAYQDFINGRR